MGVIRRKPKTPELEVFEFDANVCVEAESEEAAADLILEHCMTGADIAISLHKAGTLNKKKSDE